MKLKVYVRTGFYRGAVTRLLLDREVPAYDPLSPASRLADYELCVRLVALNRVSAAVVEYVDDAGVTLAQHALSVLVFSDQSHDKPMEWLYRYTCPSAENCVKAIHARTDFYKVQQASECDD